MLVVWTSCLVLPFLLGWAMCVLNQCALVCCRCSGVVSVLPLLSVLWGWSGVCAEVVGGVAVLWGLLLYLEEILRYM